MLSGQIIEVKWWSLLSGLAGMALEWGADELDFLGAGKQLFIVVAFLLPLRKEMDRQLSSNFQGHTVKLLKCFGTPGSSYFWPAYLGFLLSLRLTFRAFNISPFIL